MKSEASDRRVRVYYGGKLVADTLRPLLVWENPHYPAYYLPRADVKLDAIPPQHVRASSLPDHVRLEWDAMDAWFEEEEQIYGHPHDPHKRIDIAHGSRHVVVRCRGVELADSHHPTLLWETGLPTRYYLPKTDVRMHLLVATDKRTTCAYKGFASYWTYEGDEVAWSYQTPLPECVKIAALVAFYNEWLDIDVDGVRLERPTSEFSK